MNEDITVIKTKEKCPKCHKNFVKNKTHYDFMPYEGYYNAICNCPYCNHIMTFSIKGCEKIELEPKHKNIKIRKFTYFSLKYIWLLIPIILLIFYPDFKMININETKSQILRDLSFVSTSIPMIISIITIALSLGDKEIYGIPSFNFRRLRNGFYFSFLSMIIVSLILLALEAYSKVLTSNTSLVYLNFVSIIYSIKFIKQEVPILTNNDKYLMKIVKNINNEKVRNDVKNGRDSFDEDYKKVLTHLILNKGISKTFTDLSRKYTYINENLMQRLLEITDSILKDYLDNIDKIKQINDYDKYLEIKRNVKWINDEITKVFQDYKTISLKVNFEKYGISNLLENITFNLKSLSQEFKFDFYKETMSELLKTFNNDQGDDING